jgi:hypothetical protein
LTGGFGFAVAAAMPTNHTHPSAASSRLCRTAVDVLQAADELLAQPLDEYEAERYLTPGLSILAMVVDQLSDGLYHAEQLDQSHRANDLATNRMLAGFDRQT